MYYYCTTVVCLYDTWINLHFENRAIGGITTKGRVEENGTRTHVVIRGRGVEGHSRFRWV